MYTYTYRDNRHMMIRAGDGAEFYLNAYADHFGPLSANEQNELAKIWNGSKS